MKQGKFKTVNPSGQYEIPKTSLGSWIKGNGTPGLVSVIVPTYNREEYILETLDSVYAQDYRPIELIVVDDGSTDQTGHLVKKWRAGKESGNFLIQYIVQDNQGAPVARNHGTIKSAGAFIQFLDSDDTLETSKIRLEAERLEEDESLDMVYGSTFWVGTDNAPTSYKNRYLSADESLVSCINGDSGFFNTISPLFRRKILEKVGPWDESFPCSQDIDMAIRFFCSDPKYQFCKDAISYIRPGDGRAKISAPDLPKEKDQDWRKSQYKLLMRAEKILPKAFFQEPARRSLFARSLFNIIRKCIDSGTQVEVEKGLRLCRKLSEGGHFKRTLLFYRFLTLCLGKRLGTALFECFTRVYSVLRNTLLKNECK